jgi:hypothetical protein
MHLSLWSETQKPGRDAAHMMTFTLVGLMTRVVLGSDYDRTKNTPVEMV